MVRPRRLRSAAVRQAAFLREDLVDIINIVIEEMAPRGYELPSFPVLREEAKKVRAAVSRAPRLLHPKLWENRGLSYVRIQLLRSTVGRQSVGKSLSGMCKSSFFFFITLTYSSVC